MRLISAWLGLGVRVRFLGLGLGFGLGFGLGLEAADCGLDELVDGGLGEAEVEQRLAPRVYEAAARAHLLVRVRVRVSGLGSPNPG